MNQIEKIVKTMVGLVFAAGLLGCSGGEGLEGDSGEGEIGSLAQAVTGTWSPTSILTNAPKVARNPTGSPFWWGSANPNATSALVCHATSGIVLPIPGSPTCQNVSIPAPYHWSDVKAIAIAQNTSHVYTWFSDGKVFEGDSVNLSRYSSGTNFNRTSSFPMSALIDADVSSNGVVYYYWQSGSTVYRTTGTSNQEAVGAPASVITFNATLWGISFAGTRVEGWYTNSGNPNYDSSTASTNLTQ